ncbi:spore germination protein [Bacillus megaterium]|nr:spore germination protein [Priestia megaterium]
MVLILELLKEASLRLPSSIAQTIGVVGGLVIGTAIVEASLVSNMMIIVIALTAVSSFVVPSNEMSTTARILSFPMMIGGDRFWLFGYCFCTSSYCYAFSYFRVYYDALLNPFCAI